VSRDLRLLTAAVFVSAAGDLLAMIVLALRVHDLTGSGLVVSAFFATTLVPMVVLAPLAGLVADRFESVRVVAAASLAQALVAAALAFTGDVAALLALSALLTAGNAFAAPAEFALVPAVAGARGVTRATGAVEAARYAGFAAGPALAAAIAVLGTQTALLVNAASFVLVAAAVGALRARRPPAAAAGREPGGALEGVRLLRADRILRVTITAAVGALLLISAALTVEIFYVKDVLGAGDAAYAIVLGGWMGGMVLGATVLAPRVRAALLAPAALLALGIQGAGMAAQAAWTIVPVAFAGFLLGGAGHGAKNVLLRSLLTIRVPAPVRGRAFAAYNAARNTAELGALAGAGLLVGGLGPRLAIVVAGMGPVLAATAGLAALARPARRRAGAARPVLYRNSSL